MKNITWSTRFDHNENKIIHTFPSGRLAAIADRDDDSLTVFKDGKQIKRCPALMMGEYYDELLSIAKSDDELVKFSRRYEKAEVK